MTDKTKDSEDRQFQCERALLRLVTEVRRVRRCRRMDAAEAPTTQDAWDHLHLAVLEAERVLNTRVLNTPLPGLARSQKA